MNKHPATINFIRRFRLTQAFGSRSRRHADKLASQLTIRISAAMEKIERQPLYHYWQPRYWQTWLGIGVLRLTCLLPYRWHIGLGKAIGRLGHRIGAKRRAIARRNIELCFPELSPAERDKLALEHFESLGASLMELALARWASDEKLEALTTINGAEYVQQALDEGYGVILLSAHFTTLEISGRAFSLHCPPFDLVYRRFRNPLLTEFVASTREVSGRKAIEKNDIKSMVRSLREGVPVWYAPDQSYHLEAIGVAAIFWHSSDDQHRNRHAGKAWESESCPLLSAAIAGRRV